MNEREQLIVKGILSFLDKLNGGQAIETIIHAETQMALRNVGEPAPSLAEFKAALQVCDSRAWVTGVASKITGQMKWSLSDQGKAALLEMQ